MKTIAHFRLVAVGAVTVVDVATVAIIAFVAAAVFAILRLVVDFEVVVVAVADFAFEQSITPPSTV